MTATTHTLSVPAGRRLVFVDEAGEPLLQPGTVETERTIALPGT